LHSAYPFVVVTFAVRSFGEKVMALYIYPVIVWFSAVYLNHHYIIDIVIGLVYVFFAIWLTDRFVYPFIKYVAGWLKRIRTDGTDASSQPDCLC
jgi:membrane-associated phospholipid phosphatase